METQATSTPFSNSLVSKSAQTKNVTELVFKASTILAAKGEGLYLRFSFWTIFHYHNTLFLCLQLGKEKKKVTNQAHRTKKMWGFVLNGTGFAPTFSLVNWRISKKAEAHTD